MRCCDEAYAESHATSEAYAELVVGTLGVSYRGLVAGLPLTNCRWHYILHVRGSIPLAHASQWVKVSVDLYVYFKCM